MVCMPYAFVTLESLSNQDCQGKSTLTQSLMPWSETGFVSVNYLSCGAGRVSVSGTLGGMGFA